ncbi:hypothetical protein [Rahnella victoriana]|uniref:HEPN domain-containing protein n=1 Tax=Rahnella victoriana TaxID=1510570 RepID=A0ABS0DKW4_9GAMM|nr:hypothetical protein [Rahnella victoriana]MBF7954544.1 hypothetical protein [Rahnella victoriana]
MNEFQKIWLDAYRSYLKAISITGEYCPADYTAAREHADSVLNSLIKAGEVACN